MEKICSVSVGFLATNCWIYPLDNGICAVIDPGDEGKRIIARLKQLNLVPAFIILTHGHFDHIDAVEELAAEYGTQAEIAIHAADTGYLKDFKPGRTLAEGDTIGPFTVLHLPGHTPGSIGLWDKESGILFSGDTLFDDGYGRTDLPGGNEEQIFASLRRLFALDGNIQVYPGHGPTTTIGQAREILH